jgi:hypothetical protein
MNPRFVLYGILRILPVTGKEKCQSVGYITKIFNKKDVICSFYGKKNDKGISNFLRVVLLNWFKNNCFIREILLMRNREVLPTIQENKWECHFHPQFNPKRFFF